MGSPSESFVLGFTPLQIARRPTGSGGVYEPAAGDELTQLQRLIDYGVISGIEVAPRTSCRSKSRKARGRRATIYELQRAGVHGRQLRPLPQPTGFPSIDSAGRRTSF